MCRISEREHFLGAAPAHHDIGVGENRCAEDAFRSRNDDPVLGMVGIEIPHAGTHAARSEFEARGRDVFGRVAAARIESVAGGRLDRPEKEVQKIQTMGGQIQKKAGPGNCRIETPGRGLLPVTRQPYWTMCTEVGLPIAPWRSSSRTLRKRG